MATMTFFMQIGFINPSALNGTFNVKYKKISNKTNLMSMQQNTHSLMEVMLHLKRLKIPTTFLIIWGGIKLVRQMILVASRIGKIGEI